MNLPALAVLITLASSEGAVERRDDLGRHAWELSGIGLCAVSTGLFAFGSAYALHEARPDPALTGAVFGFAATALTAAIFMIIYNKLL
jgi:hypothetical protein